jgi:hypothetical protein
MGRGVGLTSLSDLIATPGGRRMLARAMVTPIAGPSRMLRRCDLCGQFDFCRGRRGVRGRARAEAG